MLGGIDLKAISQKVLKNLILNRRLPSGLMIIILSVLLISGDDSEYKISPSFMKSHIPH